MYKILYVEFKIRSINTFAKKIKTLSANYSSETVLETMNGSDFNIRFF